MLQPPAHRTVAFAAAMVLLPVFLLVAAPGCGAIQEGLESAKRTVGELFDVAAETPPAAETSPAGKAPPAAETPTSKQPYKRPADPRVADGDPRAEPAVDQGATGAAQPASASGIELTDLQPLDVSPLIEWKGRWSKRMKVHDRPGSFTTDVDEMRTHVAVSDDLQRAAITRPVGSRVAVEFGGSTGPTFDEILEMPGLVLGPTGHRLAYIGRRGDRYVVVIDGREGPELAQPPTEALAFSPSGKRFGYFGMRTGELEHVVVVDGEVVVQAEWMGELLFLADERWVARGRNGRGEGGVPNYAVYVEGELAGQGDLIAVAPDGRLVIHEVTATGGRLLVEGMEPLDGCDGLPVFSPDGQHFVYPRQRRTEDGRRNELAVVHQGVELEHAPLDWSAGNAPVVSNGGQVAFVTKTGGGLAVATAEGIGNEYETVRHVGFTPGDTAPTYVATVGKRVFLCRPGKEEEVALGRVNVVAAHESGRFAVVVNGADGGGRATSDFSWSLISNDGVHRLHGATQIDAPVFSRDGSHYACVVGFAARDLEAEEQGAWMYLNGERFARLADSAKDRLRIAPHLAEDRVTENGKPGLYWVRYGVPVSVGTPRKNRLPVLEFYRDGEVAHFVPIGQRQEVGHLRACPQGVHLAMWRTLTPAGRPTDPLSPVNGLSLDGITCLTEYPPLTRPSMGRSGSALLLGRKPHDTLVGRVHEDGRFDYLSGTDKGIHRVVYRAGAQP